MGNSHSEQEQPKDSSLGKDNKREKKPIKPVVLEKTDEPTKSISKSRDAPPCSDQFDPTSDDLFQSVQGPCGPQASVPVLPRTPSAVPTSVPASLKKQHGDHRVIDMTPDLTTSPVRPLAPEHQHPRSSKSQILTPAVFNHAYAPTPPCQHKDMSEKAPTKPHAVEQKAAVRNPTKTSTAPPAPPAKTQEPTKEQSTTKAPPETATAPSGDSGKNTAGSPESDKSPSFNMPPNCSLTKKTLEQLIENRFEDIMKLESIPVPPTPHRQAVVRRALNGEPYSEAVKGPVTKINAARREAKAQKKARVSKNKQALDPPGNDLSFAPPSQPSSKTAEIPTPNAVAPEPFKLSVHAEPFKSMVYPMFNNPIATPVPSTPPCMDRVDTILAPDSGRRKHTTIPGLIRKPSFIHVPKEKKELGNQAQVNSQVKAAELQGTKLTPNITAPNSTVPNSTAPNSTAPNSTVPNSTVPNSTVPTSTVPNSTVPNSTVPNSTVPTSTVPNSTAPNSTPPNSTVPKSIIKPASFSVPHCSPKSEQGRAFAVKTRLQLKSKAQPIDGNQGLPENPEAPCGLTKPAKPPLEKKSSQQSSCTLTKEKKSEPEPLKPSQAKYDAEAEILMERFRKYSTEQLTKDGTLTVTTHSEYHFYCGDEISEMKCPFTMPKMGDTSSFDAAFMEFCKDNPTTPTAAETQTSQSATSDVSPPTAPEPAQGAPTAPGPAQGATTVSPPTAPEPAQGATTVSPPTAPEPAQGATTVSPPTAPGPAQGATTVSPPTAPEPAQGATTVSAPTAPEPAQGATTVSPPTAPEPAQNEAASLDQSDEATQEDEEKQARPDVTETRGDEEVDEEVDEASPERSSRPEGLWPPFTVDQSCSRTAHCQHNNTALPRNVTKWLNVSRNYLCEPPWVTTATLAASLALKERGGVL